MANVPSKMVLDVQVMDSFNSVATLKLQIFSSTTKSFSFHESVPDIWIKSSDPFMVDLNITTLLGPIVETSSFPIVSSFMFELVDPMDKIPNTQEQGNLPLTHIPGRAAHPPITAPNSSSSNHAGCTYKDIWGDENRVSTDVDNSPQFLSWFNQTVFTTPQSALDNAQISLRGSIPCEVVVRVRWTARNAFGQLASTDFMIWASESGPPALHEDPHIDGTTDITARNGGAGPFVIKILVALALAVPLGLALWFLGSRYLQSRRGEDQVKQVSEDELERGRPSRHGSDVGHMDEGWRPSQDRRWQMTTENVVADYRTSLEADPSVGHRDSYSEKFVAEHGPPVAQSSASDGEGSGSGKRLSILGWFFREKEAASTAESGREGSAASTAVLSRRRSSCTMYPFSLKRISVGKPFETKRFGFVNGSGISLYDSASEESERLSAVGVGRTQQRQFEFDQTESSEHMSKAAAAQSQQAACKTMQGLHMYHSNMSTGTGYMAGMSETCSSVDDRNDSEERHSEVNTSICSEQENAASITEVRPRIPKTNSKAEMGEQARGARTSWTPSLSLMDPDLFATDDSSGQDTHDISDGEQDYCQVRELRAPERALMVSAPGSSTCVNQILDTYPRTPLSVRTACLSSSSEPSSRTDLSLKTSISDWFSGSPNTSYSLTATTTPTPTPENVFTKDRQSSLQATPGSFHRRSIVELLQSSDAPISPLSAFSASLPSWNHMAEEAGKNIKDFPTLMSKAGQEYLVARHEDQNRSESDLSCLSAYSTTSGSSQERAKWMVVPCNQPIKSVSVRKASGDPKVCSEWVSKFVEGYDVEDKDDNEGDDIIGVVGSFKHPTSGYSKSKDQRHLSLKSELAIIEQAVCERDSHPAGQAVQPVNVYIMEDATAVHSTLDTPIPSCESVNELGGRVPPIAISASILSPTLCDASLLDPTSTKDYSLNSSTINAAPLANADLAITSSATPSDIHPTSDHSKADSDLNQAHSVVYTRHTGDRMRPISCPPARAVLPVTQFAVPQGFVKATIGKAFHYTSLLRIPSASLPSSSPPSRSPSQRLSLPAASPSRENQSTASCGSDTQQPREYRAYLVSDPRDPAIVSMQVYRPLTASSVVNIEGGSTSTTDAEQARRKLPAWIQFNSKMRSLWGRPIPGSAGEWQFSLVQLISHQQAMPAPVVLPLRTKDVAIYNPSAIAAESTVVAPTAEENEPKELEEEEIERVVLLVREPGDGPLSPPLAATQTGKMPSPRPI
ncbi:hypothetical protein BGX28_003660 [Mortierella sp. GBA30]|nr:hypothetical protein BGX28_003660 [Mortierella sp. GBA30]